VKVSRTIFAWPVIAALTFSTGAADLAAGPRFAPAKENLGTRTDSGESDGLPEFPLEKWRPAPFLWKRGHVPKFSSPFSLAAAWNPLPAIVQAQPASPAQAQPPASAPSLKNPAFPGKNWGRSYAQLASLLAFTQTLYWIQYANFVEDWQYKLSWADQRERLFTLEAWRFDTNLFRVNWTHQLAGSLYYNFARANRLTWLESTLVTLCGSLWWEIVTEWREVISVNDLIITTIGGYAGGEALFQFGRFLQDTPGETAGTLSLLNPVLQLNRWIDGAPRRTGPKAAWHRFDLSFGLRVGSGPTIEPLSQTAGLRTQIINVPGYGRPGRSGGFLFDTLSSEIDFSAATKGPEAQELNLFFRTVGLGRYGLALGEDGRGSAWFLGLGTAFSLFQKRPVAFYDEGLIQVRTGADLKLDAPRNFRDKLAVVHLAGPVLDWTWFSPRGRLRCVVDGYVDFGMINAFALNEYSRHHDIRGAKTTILYYGYYFALGLTGGAEVTAEYRALRGRGLVRYQVYDSVERLDRFQEEISADWDIHDSRLRLLGSAALRLPHSPLELQAVLEGFSRRGTILEVTARELETRFTFGVNLVF